MCLTSVSIPQFIIYIFFKERILHCIVCINTDLKILKGFWASVRECCYDTKLIPSLSS